MTSKPAAARRNGLRPLANRLLVASGFVRKKRDVVDALARRIEKDFAELARVSYLSSLKRVKPKAVIRAAEQLGYGKYDDTFRNVFKAKKKSRRVAKKKESEA